jgi:3-oxoacyl-(acyl-carrier-protein) synthase
MAVRIAEIDCVTPFGDAAATLRRLHAGDRALRATPVRGHEGGDVVPLALLPDRTLDETAPPSWFSALSRLVEPLSEQGWGTARLPVCIASSNFGVGSLYAFRRHGDPAHLKYGPPDASVDWLRQRFGWGPNVALFSHACVSAHLALLHGSRLIEADVAEAVLVFSYDFLSPFVDGGFHALKILNGEFPAPYSDRPTGAIGLGDGAAFAVLRRDRGDYVLDGQELHNEMHHFTGNRPDGTGFSAVLAPLARRGHRVWLKGHGTGTLEAGRLECAAFASAFPTAPLVGWKGSIGHTLGSCGLVELAIAAAAIRDGRTPGTVGASEPTFSNHVALASFDNRGFDGVLCASNAFGGAHAALLLSHA